MMEWGWWGGVGKGVGYIDELSEMDRLIKVKIE